MTNRKTVPSQVYFVMLAGIAAVSMAAIFIRFAMTEGIPANAIAAGRLTLSALILTPFALRGHWPALRQLSRRDLLLAVASGFILAVHFATWIASLGMTSVLISVAFVCTGPLWVAILEVIFLRARLALLVIVGLVVAFIGGLVIGVGGDSAAPLTGEALMGGLLALAGAVAFAIYLVIGRKLRAKLSLIPYIWLVYGFASVFLLLLVAATGTAITGYSAQGYFWILLLAIMPQLIGHSSFNYALRYLSATFVAVATQMEPIGSAIAALILLNETPTLQQAIGSLAIIGGVILTSLGQQTSDSTATAEHAEEL
ncbi:MAG: DMT family transporter [Chloroflexi bacterium]|nr:DMT family transporter [Chloroflexota bacterium]